MKNCCYDTYLQNNYFKLMIKSHLIHFMLIKITKFYNRKQSILIGLNLKLKENATKMTLLHIFSMIGVTIFFAIFFQLEWVPQLIRDNIQLVPNGQMLAYGAYFGACLFILTCRILTKPNRNLARSTSNILKLVGNVFQNFTTMFIDLVTITVITFTFFQVGYNLNADSILFWSTFCSLTVFPYLAFFAHLALKNQKLEYTAPIFTNKIG